VREIKVIELRDAGQMIMSERREYGKLSRDCQGAVPWASIMPHRSFTVAAQKVRSLRDCDFVLPFHFYVAHRRTQRKKFASNRTTLTSSLR